MSVLMTLRVAGDAGRLEALTSEKPDVVQQILARAREYGVQAHRFYGTDEELLMVDRWPDAESFHRFMAASPEIGELMAAAGVTGEPEITFWRALDVDDVTE